MKRLTILITLFAISVALTAQSVDDHLRLGKAYASSLQFDNAIAHYGKAIQLGPVQAEAYLLRGKLYCKIGEFDRCTQGLRHAEKVAFQVVVKDRKESSPIFKQNNNPDIFPEEDPGKQVDGMLS